MALKGKFPNGRRALMDKLGIGPTELARQIGSKKQNVLRWRDQERKIGNSDAGKLARFFDVTQAEVQLPPDGSVGIARVRLINWVSAGKLGAREAVDGDIGSVLAGSLPKGDWVALKVEGDSMDLISPPESVIFVNRSDKRLAPNACYVIVDEEGNASYKRYRDKPDRFEPVSMNKNLPVIDPKKTQVRVFGRVRRTMLDF